MTSSASPQGGADHELKSWPGFFQAIADGRKRHDLRQMQDRVFKTGDRILLREFDPKGGYTGRSQHVEVTYVTSAEHPCALSGSGLTQGFCILSIVPDAGTSSLRTDVPQSSVGLTRAAPDCRQQADGRTDALPETGTCGRPRLPPEARRLMDAIDSLLLYVGDAYMAAEPRRKAAYDVLIAVLDGLGDEAPHLQ